MCRSDFLVKRLQAGLSHFLTLRAICTKRAVFIVPWPNLPRQAPSPTPRADDLLRAGCPPSKLQLRRGTRRGSSGATVATDTQSQGRCFGMLHGHSTSHDPPGQKKWRARVKQGATRKMKNEKQTLSLPKARFTKRVKSYGLKGRGLKRQSSQDEDVQDQQFLLKFNPSTRRV